jgi:EAL domain-containing protein (putative c-di-GMP-specific phosphodiesterase class I)
MYHAKERGRNHCQFFKPQLNATVQRHLQLASALHAALGNGEMKLLYQPQIELATGRIIAAEALLRWHNADLGSVPTPEFIRVAEDSGLIAPIGEWVLRQACHDLRHWRDTEHPDLVVAVNLAPQQVRREDFVDLLRRVLAESALPPSALVLEITEGTLRQGEEHVRILDDIAALGVGLAVDDFGNGNASVGYLQRFRFDTVKIDRCFVERLGTAPQGAALVKAIIAMARSLGLAVVAEGVETIEQLAQLRFHGCGIGQGFFWSEPLDAAAFGRLLATSTAANDTTTAARLRDAI